MLELFKRSGVPFEVINSHTTVDAPPTVYHIREQFKRLEEQGIKTTIHMPELTMWQLIPKKKMPPCRMQRYCCEYLKENTVKIVSLRLEFAGRKATIGKIGRK